MAKAFKDRPVLPFVVLLLSLVVGVALANGLAVLIYSQLAGVHMSGRDLARGALVCLLSAPMLWLLGVSPLRRVSLETAKQAFETFAR